MFESITNIFGSIKSSIDANILNSINRRTTLDIKDTDSLSILLKDNIQDYFKKSIVFFVILFIVSLCIYYATTDALILTSRTYYYALLIFIPLFVGIYLSTDISSDSSSTKVFILTLVFFTIAIIGNYVSSNSANSMQYLNYVLYVLFFLIVIVGLALFYFIFGGYLQKQTGTMGYIINLIFYIPCLLNEFVLYIKTQIGITPNVVYILFMIEILLILLYIYFPKLVNYYSQLNSITLLNEPVYIDVEIPIVKDKKIFLLKDNERVKTNVSEEKRTIYRNNNYSFSFWVFMNPGSKSKIEYMKETNIFNYANGKPKVTCMNDPVEPFKNKYIVYFTNNDKKSIGSKKHKRKTNETKEFEIYLPFQRWNNFVFNYYENTADLFINGKLEKSFNFNNDNIPLNGTETDDVIVGSNTGLNGAICNVKYFTFPQTTAQIAYNYNTLMFSNPPIYSP